MPITDAMVQRAARKLCDIHGIPQNEFWSGHAEAWRAYEEEARSILEAAINGK